LQTLLKIRQIVLRLGISFSILLLVLIAVGWLGLHQMDRNNARLAEIQGKDWDTLTLAQEALRYSSINSRITLQLFLPQDESQIRALLAVRAENSNKIGEILEKIEPLCDSAQEINLLADIKANRRRYVESYTRALHLQLDEKNAAAATRVLDRETTPELFKYHESFNDLVQLEVSQIERATAERKVQQAGTRRLVLLAVVLSVFLTGLIALLATRSIVVSATEQLAIYEKMYAELQRSVAQQERAEGQIRLQSAALESAANAIVITDAHGTIQWVNPAFVKLTGYALKEVVGGNPRLLKSGKQDETFYRNLWRTILSGEVWTGEIANRRKDGQLYTEEMTIAPVRSEAGEITNFVAIKQDVTHRKLAEAELAKAKVEAEAANRAKSEFLANMSHEIRTPMNGIIGMTDLLLETQLDPEQADYLQMVKESADALLTLLNDILDFSKMEAGKLELDNLDFDLRKSLGGAVKTLAIQAQKKGLEFIFDVRPEVPIAVFGDPARIRQVLVNLLGNAIKFTEMGDIEVRVQVDSQSREGTILRFSIRDTGIGIPSNKLDKIFRAFSQADSSTTRRYGGTGLGLTISAQLAGLMGGRIWVESEPGRGSTFYFTVRLGPGASALPGELLDGSQLERVPVLVVDDNATNRKILEDSLTRWNMTPTVVEGAKSAMRILQHAGNSGATLPLVLTDARMPEVDGFGLVEMIRQDPLLAGVRIVMLTSGGERGDVARCRKLGVAAYLSKPFDRLELREVLLRVLAGSQPMRDNRSVVTRHTLLDQSQSLSFLVAEDNAVNQKLVARLLEKRGHSVVLAVNGREALSALEKRPFDVVLMDGEMPEMDGFEATRRIREKEKLSGSHLPIIALTAHAMQGDKDRCLAGGMDGYVSKPIKLEELFSVIDDVIRRVTRNPEVESLNS
jgi:two-component system sensor histidine kinase/response regulator